MTKIINFVYVMFLFILLFFVVVNVDGKPISFSFFLTLLSILYKIFHPFK